MEKERKSSSVLVNFRVTPEESEELDRLSEAAHMSKTTFIKQKIFCDAPAPVAQTGQVDLEPLEIQGDALEKHLARFEKKFDDALNAPTDNGGGKLLILIVLGIMILVSVWMH